MSDANAAPTEGIPIPSPVPDPLSMREVLAIAPMRRIWYAQTISVFGDLMALFAVITVMTFDLHATPQQITGVQIAYLLPIAVLGVISGVFVDRWPVKTTLVSSDFGFGDRHTQSAFASPCHGHVTRGERTSQPVFGSR